MKRRPAWSAPALALAALAATGCGPSRGASVAADVQVARAEQSADKLLERGRAFASVGDNTRAEQYLSAALNAGAPREAALPALLKVCIAENRLRAALTYAEPQLAAHPGDFRLRFVIASLYASIGDAETALAHLERVAAEHPDYAEVQYAMGMIFHDGGRDLARADVHFREYLRLEPQGRHAEQARGLLLKPVLPAAGGPGGEDAAPPASQPGPDVAPVAPAAPVPPKRPAGAAPQDSNWKTVP